MVIKKILKYETYVVLGMLLSLAVLVKIIFKLNISSDWFWFLAGIALLLEGVLDLKKQKRFNEKYKIVSKEEYGLILNSKKA